MTTDAADVIEINDLRKVFPPASLRGKAFEALRGISFKVAPGSSFGFLGPNGAGKTTTIKILTGLITATSGTAKVLGRPPSDPDGRRVLGYLPENPSFPDHLTGREVLRFMGMLHGMPAQQIEKRIPEVLDLVALTRAGNTLVRRYSKGMVQRLGIAQALIHEPKMVILDEPMSGLDPLGRHAVKDMITTLRSAGITVFFSTHIISDVEQLCDELVILVNGKVVRAGPVKSIISNEAREYEVVASKLPKEFPGAALSANTNVTLTAQNEGEARALIERIWQAGGEVLALSPRRYSLEQIFISDVQSNSNSRKWDQVD